MARVEDLVNGWVADAHALETRVMGLDEARGAGATAMFGEKYDDVVRVVDVPGERARARDVRGDSVQARAWCTRCARACTYEGRSASAALGRVSSEARG